MTGNNNKDVTSIDRSRIDELSAVLGDDVTELIDDFFKVSQQELQQLKHAIDSGQTEAIFNLCHNLKSSSGNLGFLRLHELCKRLELQARANQVIDAAGQYALIMAEFEGLRNELGV